MANLGGLRARSSLKQPSLDLNNDDEECRPWRRRITMAFSWASAFRITLLLLLLAAVIAACFTLPIEKMMKNFLIWIDRDLGRWGPLVLVVAYIPLTVLAVPASVLTPYAAHSGMLKGLPRGIIHTTSDLELRPLWLPSNLRSKFSLEKHGVISEAEDF